MKEHLKIVVGEMVCTGDSPDYIESARLLAHRVSDFAVSAIQGNEICFESGEEYQRIMARLFFYLRGIRFYKALLTSQTMGLQEAFNILERCLIEHLVTLYYMKFQAWSVARLEASDCAVRFGIAKNAQSFNEMRSQDARFPDVKRNECKKYAHHAKQSAEYWRIRIIKLAEENRDEFSDFDLSNPHNAAGKIVRRSRGQCAWKKDDDIGSMYIALKENSEFCTLVSCDRFDWEQLIKMDLTDIGSKSGHATGYGFPESFRKNDGHLYVFNERKDSYSDGLITAAEMVLKMVESLDDILVQDVREECENCWEVIRKILIKRRVNEQGLDQKES